MICLLDCQCSGPVSHRRKPQNKHDLNISSCLGLVRLILGSSVGITQRSDCIVCNFNVEYNEQAHGQE